MAYERKPGDIAIFKNTNRQQDTHAEYSGKVLMPDGQEAYVDLWVKEGKSGKFFSGRVKFPEPKADSFRGGTSQGVARGGDRRPAFDEPLDDEIPFVTAESVW